VVRDHALPRNPPAPITLPDAKRNTIAENDTVDMVLDPTITERSEEERLQKLERENARLKQLLAEMARGETR
jgi:hypothetical protein